MSLPEHHIGIDEQDSLFRCAVCGGEWLFNPLTFPALASCLGPAWVRADAICSRLWEHDAAWRQNVLLAGENEAAQRLLIKLAWKTAGGSQGEAVEA